MLSITTASSGLRSFTRTPTKFHVPAVGGSGYIWAYLACPNKPLAYYTERYRSSSDEIITGAPTKGGNRPCKHYKLEGHVSANGIKFDNAELGPLDFEDTPLPSSGFSLGGSNYTYHGHWIIRPDAYAAPKNWGTYSATEGYSVILTETSVVHWAESAKGICSMRVYSVKPIHLFGVDGFLYGLVWCQTGVKGVDIFMDVNAGFFDRHTRYPSRMTFTQFYADTESREIQPTWHINGDMSNLNYKAINFANPSGKIGWGRGCRHWLASGLYDMPLTVEGLRGDTFVSMARRNLEIAFNQVEAKMIVHSESLVLPKPVYDSPVGFNGANSTPLWDEVDKLARAARPWADIVVIPDQEDWIQMSYDCLEALAKFSSNLIAYAGDLPAIGETVRSILGLVADPSNPKQWASTYMALRFTDRLTYADSVELFESIRAELQRAEKQISGFYAYRSGEDRRNPWYSRGRARRRVIRDLPLPPGISAVDEIIVQSIYARDQSYTDTMSVVKKLMDWDAWPTLENAWDMIPLSFVVDWFLNLSETLSQIDTFVYSRYVVCDHRVWSRKKFLHLELGDLIPNSFIRASDASFTFYERGIDSAFPIEPRFSWSPSLPSFLNFFDGLALLVQSS